MRAALASQCVGRSFLAMDAPMAPLHSRDGSTGECLQTCRPAARHLLAPTSAGARHTLVQQPAKRYDAQIIAGICITAEHTGLASQPVLMATARGASSRLAALLRRHTSSAAADGSIPDFVRVVEVGPRDGLQNEPTPVATADKIRLINMLGEAGVPVIEATSFVSPKWVPQMADAAEVLQGMQRAPGVRYPVLTPNMKGLEAAIAAGATEVAVFPAATQSFNRRNLNCSTEDSLRRFAEVARTALDAGLAVRGYVSVAMGCPYEGRVEPREAAAVVKAVLDMGCYEVSVGDTIGVGTPGSISAVVRACLAAGVPVAQLALHLHDTYGMAAANCLAALQLGVATFDASVAGLGGCPFAKGATGNMATEDLVYLLNGLGVRHGVDLAKLLAASEEASRVAGRPPVARAARALLAARDGGSDALRELVNLKGGGDGGPQS